MRAVALLASSEDPASNCSLPEAGAAAKNAIDSERTRRDGFTPNQPSELRHWQASSNLCTCTSEAYYMAWAYAALETNRCLRPKCGEHTMLRAYGLRDVRPGRGIVNLATHV